MRDNTKIKGKRESEKESEERKGCKGVYQIAQWDTSALPPG